MSGHHAFPVSIKGVVVRGGKVLLLKNDRDEWESPGGRIEIGETPEQCVVREIAEKAQWTVIAGPVLDSWMYHIESVDRHVFIVTYGCHTESDFTPTISSEHMEIGLFTEQQLADLRMPDGYRRSILAWYARRRAEIPEPAG